MAVSIMGTIIRTAVSSMGMMAAGSLNCEALSGYSIVLCEQVRYLDLSSRRWSKLTQTHYFDIMDISDAVVSMFEYQ